MQIKPDLFFQNNDKQSERLLGLEYPDCPLKRVCAYVDFDHEPVSQYRCEFFREPEKGKREPVCLCGGA